MKEDKELLQYAKQLLIAKYPRFANEIAGASLIYDKNLPTHTAATDGKDIFVDPEYFASLDDQDKLFTIAHEFMHISILIE